MMAKKAKRRRWIQGRNYHGWAWEQTILGQGFLQEKYLFFFALGNRDKPQDLQDLISYSGKWVRVKFVESPGPFGKRGVDWHGWVWKGKVFERDKGPPYLYYWAEEQKPKWPISGSNGKWVRVKFVEVK